ncbi:MAG: metal ABC transporter substrate-binding protein [Pseudomonadota bacterium]
MYRLIVWLFLGGLGVLPGMVYAKLNVVATTADGAAIVRAIGGKHVQVQSLTPGTRDPHFAEATPGLVRQVYGADLLVLIGADIEIGWLPPLLETARNSRILPGAPGYIDLSAAVTLLDKSSGPVSRAEGDVHARGNPHYWLDPRNGALMAQAVAARLSKIDPGHAPAFRANLDAFERELGQRLPQWQARLAPWQDQPVVAYHKSFVYLAHAFGFRIVAEIEPKPGIPPHAAHLRQLVETIRAQKIGVLIMEPYYERRSATWLARETGIRIVVLPQSVGARPDIVTWFDLFDAIVDAFNRTGFTP